MAKSKESINNAIFYALKNSETSGVPVYLIGNPGCGKSTTVEMFAKLNGYKLITLRGSTCSETDIMGFQSFPGGDTTKVIHVRPSWFDELLENHNNGFKTLLFLDELSTVNTFVQSALLHLIFERKVESETIPEDTLIVSAGNYANNMTSEFGTLSAIFNRFAIFNITADEDALDEFLSVYDGASTGNMTDLMTEKASALERMNNQHVEMTDEMKNRVSQYFEKAIKETCRSLMKSGDKPVNLNCTETQSVYNGQDGDEMVRGFISLRTLGYLVRMTKATFENFGKSGIQSSNFKKVVEGLCGIGLSRKNGEVIATKVADNFYNSIVQTLSSIDKLSNSKIKVYEDFFNKLVGNVKTELSKEETVAILNKFTEMSNDEEVKDVSKPLEDTVVTKLCELLKYNSRKIITIKIKPDEDIAATLTTEKTTGMIARWNLISDLFTKVADIVRDPKNVYDKKITDSIDGAKEKLTEDFMKIGSYSKLTAANYPEFKTLMPEIHKL